MYAFTAVTGSHFTAKIEKKNLRTNEKLLLIARTCNILASV